MKIYNRIDEIIGKTPLLRAKNLEKQLNLDAKLVLKLEKFNPAGSTKDRVALFMINDAEKKGIIKPGATVIEPTSGNTGIGLACIGACRGYKVILVMPDTMSKERILLLKAYGAQVVLTDGKLGMQGAIEKALEIKENTPNSFIPSQFENIENSNAHYQTTAKEIWDDTDGQLSVFVAGIGSAGSISGNGKFFKEKNKDIKVVGVEPSSSPLITKGQAGAHKIQGIGANFIPKIYDEKVVDEVLGVTDEEAYRYVRLLAKTEGVLIGISSGAVISAGVKLAKRPENKGEMIVLLLADTGERYLSTEDLF